MKSGERVALYPPLSWGGGGGFEGEGWGVNALALPHPGLFHSSPLSMRGLRLSQCIHKGFLDLGWNAVREWNQEKREWVIWRICTALLDNKLLNIIRKMETKQAMHWICVPGPRIVATTLNMLKMEEYTSKESWRKEKERSKAKLTPHLLRSEGCAASSVVLCKAGSHRATRCTVMLITRIC